MQYLKKKPETAGLLLLLGLVVLAGIALAVPTASNRKAEQAASEAARRQHPGAGHPVGYRPEDPNGSAERNPDAGVCRRKLVSGGRPDYHLDESSCNAMLTAVSALNANVSCRKQPGRTTASPLRRPP